MMEKVVWTQVLNRSNLFSIIAVLPLILELENLETKIFNLEEDMDWLGNKCKDIQSQRNNYYSKSK